LICQRDNLGHAAAALLQDFLLYYGFHTSGDDLRLELELVSEKGAGFDNRGVGLAVAYLGGEGAVNS
jgi:hypothetical protein